MFRSIIVPLDGSAFGEYAIPYAVAAARRTGIPIRLLHVHKPYLPGEALEPLPQYQFQHITEFDLRADAEARRREQERLDVLAEALSQDGVTATGHVRSGRVAESITAFAGETEDNLLVMSTHGRSGFERLWLGSVADAVVRHGSTPVLLVRPQEGEPPRSTEIDLSEVLVPVDGSAFSGAILPPLLSLLGAEPASVTFFEITQPAEASAAFSPIWPGGAAGAEESTEYLQALQESLPHTVARAAQRVIARHPALAILEEAKAGSYGFIAMATHGMGGAHHLLLGSTADKVMRGTEKPIMLYRPHLALRAPGAEAPVTAEVFSESLVVREITLGG